MKAKVLLIDNDLDWHERFKLRFEPLGFEVRAVAGLLEALKALSREIFHMAIVDKRLQDDKDSDDVSGWSLIDKLREVDPTLPCVMLTGFPEEVERVKRSDVFYVAKQTVVKRDVGGGFVGTNAIADKYRRDWSHNEELNIVPVLALPSLLSDMDFQGGRYRTLPEQQRTQADEEFDLLLKRLFKQPARKVTLSPFRQGKSGTGIFLAQPDDKLKGVLKCGDREKVVREFKNYKEYVEQYVANRTVTSEERKSETRSLGAILYSLVGHSTRDPRTFSQFFESASTEEIIRVLENLFCDTLSTWYGQADRRSVVDLSRLYQKALWINSDLITEVKQEKAEAVAEEVSLLSLHSSAAEFVFEYFDSASIMMETQTCIQHGDLHSENILVENGSAWLIDFAHTGPSHIFRDLARLEVSVKMDLGGADDLWSLLELEKSLIVPDIFSISLGTTSEFANSTNNEDLDKAYKVICSLRQIADRVSDRKSQLVEYFVALLYTTLFRLQFFPADTHEGKRQIAQGLLSCEQLATLLRKNNVGIRIV